MSIFLMTFFNVKKKKVRVKMKKYIIFLIMHSTCTIFGINDVIPTNTNNTTVYTITFEDPWLLQQRLADHDRRYRTTFYDLSTKYNIHKELGNKTRDYVETMSFIKKCIEKDNPGLPESERINQKNAIIKALCGSLNIKAAKL